MFIRRSTNIFILTTVKKHVFKMLLPVLMATCIVTQSTVAERVVPSKDDSTHGASSYDSMFDNFQGGYNPDSSFNMPHQYSYACQNNKCVRKPRSEEPFYQSFEACSLTCGQYGSLWPAPTKEAQLDQELVIFHPNFIKFTKIEVPEKIIDDMLHEALHYFLRKLHFKHSHYPQCYKGPFTDYEFKAIYGEKHPNNKKLKSSHSNRDDGGSSKKKRRTKRSGSHKKDDSYSNDEKWSQINSEADQKAWLYHRMSPFNSKAEQNHGRWMPSNKVHIEITIASGDHDLKLDTDESYSIVIQTASDTTTVSIQAKTYFGARHALETLNQMIEFCSENNALYIIKQAKITDEPSFRYRGIMLDTGHNYFTKDEILRLLDAMASNKLNSFHWHMIDTTSFPFITTRSPKMPMYGAYSPQKTYSPMDVWEIVKYANQRGIRVVPEFSAPGHVGSGWKWDKEMDKNEKMVLCFDEDKPWYNYCSEPPCGQLNPVNQEVFNYLERIYMDMIQYFDPELFHMGGNDVSFQCWKQSSEVKKYLKDAGKKNDDEGMMELWNTFQEQAYNKLTEAYGKYRDDSVTPIFFSSDFCQKHLDSKKYIIQITNAHNDSEIESYIKNGYRVIFSNYDAWNFEGPAHTWIGERDSTYSNIPRPCWKQVYDNSPFDILIEQGMSNARTEEYNSVLGGEATIWSYETDDASLQVTLWPRASAMAERLWTDPKTHADDAQHRIAAHRERMVKEGTRAEVFEPEYCHRNQGSCYSRKQYGSTSEHTTDEPTGKTSRKSKTERKVIAESTEEEDD